MRSFSLIAFFALFAASPITGVAQDKPAAPATQPSIPPQNVGGIDAKDGGTITGVIRFKGEKPAPRPITELAGNAFCKNCFKDKPLPNRDNIVFGKNGDDDTVQNVLVYVSKGLEGKTFEVPNNKVVLDQIDCIYIPHVVAVMVGQTLEVRNSDATLHNVMATPQNNPSFNVGMPVRDQKVDMVFKKPEFKINTRCFMHPWMSAYVHVLEHPFFAVTGPDGTYTLKGLPLGEYELTVLHEASLLEAKETTVKIKVEAGKEQKADFTYGVRG